MEGAILDITGFEDGDCDIGALLAAMEAKADVVNESVDVRVPKTDEELLNDIYDGCHCSRCRRSIYSATKTWKGSIVCGNCHKVCRRSEHSREITEYVREVYRRGCAFCDIRNGRFHLDHTNMFTKVNSVGVMMEEGAPAEEIIAEINKCQLLCVNCHGLVTRFEAKRGFITEKKRLNKRIAKGEDVTELRKRLHDEYDVVMTKMYPLIREKAVRVWGEPMATEEEYISDSG